MSCKKSNNAPPIQNGRANSTNSSTGDQCITAFRDFTADPLNQGTWWPVEAIIDIMKNCYHVYDLDISAFNYAMSKDPTYGPAPKIGLTVKEGNDTGVFRNPRKVRCDDGKKRPRHFYYALKREETEYPYNKIDWQKYYDNNRFRFSQRSSPSPSPPLSGKKRSAIDANTNAANMILHSNAKVPAINNTEKAGLKESAKLLQLEIGNYWDSKDACNLFDPNDGESVVAALDR